MARPLDVECVPLQVSEHLLSAKKYYFELIMLTRQMYGGIEQDVARPIYFAVGWGETRDSFHIHSLHGGPSWDIAPFQVPAEKYQRGNKKTITRWSQCI